MAETLPIDDTNLPDEGEALPVDVKAPDSERLTAGDLWSRAPDAVKKGVGGTALAQ